jgi:hypothetical protein
MQRIRLTESDLNRLVNRIIGEQFQELAGTLKDINSVRSAVEDMKVVSKELELIKSSKPNYIKQYGQKSYTDLVSKLFKKQINKDEFLKELSSKKEIGPVKGSKGIVMTQSEINKITDMSNRIANGQFPNGILKINNKGNVEDIIVNFEKKDNGNIAYVGFTKNWKQQLVMNVKNLPKRPEDIKSVIYHEVTHLKDPAPNNFAQNKSGDFYMKGSGSHYANKARKLWDKVKEIEKNTPKGQPFPQEYYDLKKQVGELQNKYQFAPKEKVAHSQQIYNSIPDKINGILRNYSSKFGRKKALETLDSILRYFKGGGGNVQNIIGSSEVKYLNDLKNYDLKQYQELVKKIIQEVENTRSQL